MLLTISNDCNYRWSLGLVLLLSVIKLFSCSIKKRNKLLRCQLTVRNRFEKRLERKDAYNKINTNPKLKKMLDYQTMSSSKVGAIF